MILFIFAFQPIGFAIEQPKNIPQPLNDNKISTSLFHEWGLSAIQLPKSDETRIPHKTTNALFEYENLVIKAEREALNHKEYIESYEYILAGYDLHSQEGVSIYVTTKVQTLEQYTYNRHYIVPLSSLQTSNNTTVAINGKYYLTEKWALVGTLKTTAFTSQATVPSTLNNNNEQVAIIGATYAF
jgi:hypothetical protein